MSDAKPKRFRLSIVNAAEDVPRLIRAYGKACHGEFGLVLRPPEHRGALVLIRKDGATMWKSGEAGDAPGVPATEIGVKDAVKLVRTEQKSVPKPGPITLRGSWSGWLHCDEGKPRVELSRKLAAYGVLTLESGEGGWTWSIVRAEKWFTKPGADSGVVSTLVAAIEAGLARAMGLLGEACSVRDSRRRAAIDAEYATVHPVKPAKEGKDPTERIREPKPPKATKAAPAPEPAPEPEKAQWEIDFDNAMATVGPGNWRALTELYASPDDSETQAALVAWLDKYAKNADDAKALLDGRDNAGEAGIRDNAYDEIARRLHFEPMAKKRGRVPRTTGPAAPLQADAESRPARKWRAGLSAGQAPRVDAAKDKALLDAFSTAVATALKADE